MPSILTNEPVTPGRRSAIAKFALGVSAVILLAVAGREAGDAIPRFANWVNDLGPLGPLVFIGGYALAVVAFVPGSLLTLAAGAIFGIGAGAAYVLVAATAGAVASFLVARYLARESIQRRIGTSPRFAAIDRALAREGLKIAFLLRLSPAFPFSLLNYGMGLTRIRLRDYALASAGMLPGTLLYVYYGKVAGDVAALAGGAAADKGPGYYAVLALGLAATALVTAVITRTARRALAETTASDAAA